MVSDKCLVHVHFYWYEIYLNERRDFCEKIDKVADTIDFTVFAHILELGRSTC